MWMFCICLVATIMTTPQLMQQYHLKTICMKSSYCNSLDISMLSLMSLHVHSLDFDLLEEIFP